MNSQTRMLSSDRFAVSKLPLVFLLCSFSGGCFLDRTAIAPGPSYDFSVRPRTAVCANSVDTIRVAWDVRQVADCRWDGSSPSCVAVGLEVEPGSLPRAVDPRESDGEVLLSGIEETTTIRFLLDDSVVETVEVTAIGLDEIEWDPVPYTVNRRCEGTRVVSETMDLPAAFSPCVMIGLICNQSSLDVVLNEIPSNPLRRDVLLERGRCTDAFAGEPVEIAVAPMDPLIMQYCREEGGVDPVMTEDPPERLYPGPLQFSVQIAGCAPLADDGPCARP